MTPVVFAALAILATASAPTNVAPVKVTPVPATELSDSKKIVCKRQEVTGSRFSKRVCATKADWAVVQKKQEQGTSDFFRQANENSGMVRSDYSTIPANGVSQAQTGITGPPGFAR
jgi:hypothetical protein